MSFISKSQGFTLIELMIVIVIIGILSSIALPAYQQFAMRGNRGDGISAIQMILDAQERYYADNITYTSNLSNLGLSNPYITPNKHYSIRAAKCDSSTPLTQCVKLTATARGGQTKDGNLIADTRGRQERNDGSVKSW